MGLKLNAATVMIGGFVALSVAAGALLVQEPGATAQTLPAEIDSANFAKAGPAPAVAQPPKPRDERFVIKRVLPITGPIKYGEFHWDEAGAPDGPLVMTVDLEARVLSVFRGGYEIGATAVLLGTQEKPTPLGVFPVMWKKAEHYSSIYDGAPMPFTLRLTNDGIAIHGTTVEKGYASHGCVGVPTPFAKKLFGAAKLGDQVYITRGKRIGKGDSLTGS
ncbi:L,D-transpeptidase family protein [Novosphingobium sp.]|uniref:L,D-transpeptidase family protein n=1 Tax=Novosphingobium sp. TaxID=1874826 RepID=UPI002735592C|nr:L,D-transpeptidase family protein [Novosphingobium sp.]MDP3907882.1 L,D-transpeptidase family protein [Novosphingobium sp.]